MWFAPSNFAQASGCSPKAFMPDCATSDSLPALWVTSSGTPTLRPSSWPGWRHRLWSRLLYGSETLRLSDGADGLAQWIASLRASHASHTAWPEAERAPTTNAGYGRQLPTAFAWFDHGSLSWKTSPGCDLLGEWLPYSQTWPRSGSVSNGTACGRPTWAPATSESGFSSWPTARSTDVMRPSAPAQWMTPCVPNGGRAVSAEIVVAKGMTATGKKTVPLESQVRHVWPTPDTITSSYSNGRKDPSIREKAANWPTPSAAVMNDGEPPESWLARAATLKAKHGNGNGAGMPLTVAASSWPTPASRDAKGENSETHATLTGGGRKHMDQLPNFVAYSPQVRAIPAGLTSSASGLNLPRRRLNPNFAEWLMGWPTGWTVPDPTACGASETALWRSKLDAQLSRLVGALVSGREAA